MSSDSLPPRPKRGRPSKAVASTRPPTRARILAAAAAMLLEYGASGLSVEQVAQRAGITPAALYRYFDDKAHLVRATLEHVLLEYSPASSWLGADAVVDATALPGIVMAIAEPAAMPMRRFGADATAASFNDQRLLTQLQELNGQIVTTIARGIADGQRAGTVRADLDPDAAARFVLVLLAGLTTLDAIDPALVGNAAWSAFVQTQLSTMLGLS